MGDQELTTKLKSLLVHFQGVVELFHFVHLVTVLSVVSTICLQNNPVNGEHSSNTAPRDLHCILHRILCSSCLSILIRRKERMWREENHSEVDFTCE